MDRIFRERERVFVNLDSRRRNLRATVMLTSADGDNYWVLIQRPEDDAGCMYWVQSDQLRPRQL